MPSTPIRDSFRSTWRCPGLVPAEIAWRWSAGAAFWALLVLSFIEYFGSLEVSKANEFLWKIGYPPLAAEALADTIAGSGHKLLMMAAILIPGTAIVWTVAAAIGRTATLRAMMPERTVRFRTMLGISFFRSAALLASLIGFAGVFAIAQRLYSDGPGTVSHPARAIWTLLPGWLLVGLIWSLANWFLSLAPVVAVEQNCDAVAASIGSVRLVGERLRPFLRVSAAFGAIHLVAFAFFSVVSGLPFMFLAVSVKLVFILLVLVTLVYFAIVDFLYIARLGAYAALAGGDSAEVSVSDGHSAATAATSSTLKAT